MEGRVRDGNGSGRCADDYARVDSADGVSDAELARIEALAKAATPGDWEATKIGEKWYVTAGRDASGALIVATPGGRDKAEWEGNTAFIAAAREVVPKLVAALRSARRENTRLLEQAAHNANLSLNVARDFEHRADAAERDRKRIERELHHTHHVVVVDLEERFAAAESERDALRERCEKAEAVVEAAREALHEYDSHGGKDTHKECPACVCHLPRDMDRLGDMLKKYDAAREGGK